jgi:alkylation response protein AidB-like acyl-CoA dehydrogenase
MGEWKTFPTTKGRFARGAILSALRLTKKARSKLSPSIQTTAVKQGDEFFVARGTKHRIMAGSEPLLVLEIAVGEFDEEDITRFDDKYGRV